MEPEVLVLITGDLDPDRPHYGGAEYSSRQGNAWRGFEEGVPRFLAAVGDWVDPTGQAPRATWFVRADKQVQAYFADPAGFHKHYADRLRDLAKQGHEVGWHPHFWRWSGKHESWYMEYNDTNWMEDCLRQGFAAIPGEFRPVSVRMGCGHSSNRIMRRLVDLGLKADFSAIPGIRNLTTIPGNLPGEDADWRGAPWGPYYPSAVDYRRPAAPGEEALPLLEVPFGTYPLPARVVWRRLLANLLPYRPGKGLRRPCVVYRKFHHLMAALNPAYFRWGTEYTFRLARLGDGPVVHSSYFHPDELLRDQGPESLANLEKNLETIRDVSTRLGIPYRFVTGREVEHVFREWQGRK